MNEFSEYDPDLRDYLDELISRSMTAIKAIHYADRVMNHVKATHDLKTEAMRAKNLAYTELENVSRDFQSTIGFH